LLLSVLQAGHIDRQRQAPALSSNGASAWRSAASVGSVLLAEMMRLSTELFSRVFSYFTSHVYQYYRSVLLLVCVQTAEMAVGEGKLNAVIQLGDKLLASTAVSGREAIRLQLAGARMTWNQLLKDVAEHCLQCRERVDAVQVFTESLARLNAWLDQAENRLAHAEKCCIETPFQCKNYLKSLQV